MNREWRAKDRATDVLSFPQHNSKSLRCLQAELWKKKIDKWCLGDVVISVEYAKEQSKEKGITLNKELEILLAHGILHLLGYDHELGLKEARRMKRLERILLTR